MEPPGFLGVPSGEPTVPNLKDKAMLSPFVCHGEHGDSEKKLKEFSGLCG
jgi:hypothetical protein